MARQLFERVQLKHALITADVSSFTEEHQDLAKKAKNLPCTNLDSIFDKTFMKKNQLSFQAHLERIADYLVLDPGIWWEDIGDQIRFFDGGCQPGEQPEGPTVGHFRHAKVKDELKKVKACWEACITENVQLPVNEVRLEHGG